MDGGVDGSDNGISCSDGGIDLMEIGDVNSDGDVEWKEIHDVFEGFPDEFNGRLCGNLVIGMTLKEVDDGVE